MTFRRHVHCDIQSYSRVGTALVADVNESGSAILPFRTDDRNNGVTGH
jgi:hypothetical protein